MNRLQIFEYIVNYENEKWPTNGDVLHVISLSGYKKCKQNSRMLRRDCTTSLNLDNYIFVRKDCETGIGGGVGCFIREDIKWQRRIDLESAWLETLWLEIFVKNSKSLLICILFRPPNSSKHLHKDFESILQDMLSTGVCEDKETILLGDLNFDYLRQRNNKEIKYIINVNGLKQIIKAPTTITKDSKTFIDVIATTHEQNIANSITHVNSISDHDLVGIVMKKIYS